MQLSVLITITIIIKNKTLLENKFKKINLYNTILTSVFMLGIIFQFIALMGYKEKIMIKTIERGKYNTIINSSNKTIKNFNNSIDYLNLIDSNDYYKVLKYPYNLNNLSMILNYNSISSYYSLTPKIYKEIVDDLVVPNYYTSYGFKEFNYRTRITSLFGSKYLITNNKESMMYGYKKELDVNNENYIFPKTIIQYHLQVYILNI